jgi:hypothetical protein
MIDWQQEEKYVKNRVSPRQCLRIRDPMLFDPGIRDGKKKSGSGIRDEHHRSFFRGLRNSF